MPKNKKTTRTYKKVNAIPILNCKNKKYGCKVVAKRYTCYKRMRKVENKNKPDVISLTNSKNKNTKRLKTPLMKIVDWFTCK